MSEPFLGTGWRFPILPDEAGRLGYVSGEQSIEHCLRALLLTATGERVMRPDFGSGLLGLVFEPGGPELVAATEHLVQGALQQELGHLIAVESVRVTQDDGALSVVVTYVVLRTQERTAAAFARSSA